MKLLPNPTRATLAALLLVGACAQGGTDSSEGDDVARAHGFGSFNKWFSPKTLNDLNPDPNITEVFLWANEKTVFIPGIGPTEVLAYNNRIPGPTIEAEPGERLIVHFMNFMDEETTVHWHGLDVPANMDGSHISQGTVPPGGYFRYEFDLINPAGTYWFHPHVRTNETVEKGLYATLVIDDPDEDEAFDLPDTEYVTLLDDVLLDDTGIAAPFPEDPAARATTQLNGREGNELLVNGKPNATLYALPGQPIRLKMVNVANARFMRLSFPGDNAYRIRGDQGLLAEPEPISPIHMVPMGGGHGGMDMGGMDMDDGMDHGGMDMDDGMDHGGGHDGGDHDMPMMSDPDINAGLMLTPGERAEVVFTPRGEPGESIYVKWHDFPRGRHKVVHGEDGGLVIQHAHDDGMRPPQEMLEIKLIAPPWWDEPADDYEPPAVLNPVDPIDTTGAAPLDVRFGHGQPNADGDIMFFAQMVDGAPVPFPMLDPDDAYDVTVGETRVWEVTNMTMGMHNFHTHGFTFQLIETEYIDMVNPENNMVMPADSVEVKDTIQVPGRPGGMGTSRTVVRLAAYFGDEGREGQVAASGKEPSADGSGGWLMHCHLLEHSARGMMSFFEVAYPED